MAEENRVLQAFYGTLFTWGMTAAGAAVVFIVPSSFSVETERKLLDFSLGVAAGKFVSPFYVVNLLTRYERCYDCCQFLVIVGSGN